MLFASLNGFGKDDLTEAAYGKEKPPILWSTYPADEESGELASPARFERAAFRLGGERSILLSYRRMYEIVVFEPYALFAKVEGFP